MLRDAARFKHERVELLLMDGEDLLFPAGSFDYVVISHVLAVTKNPDQLVNQIYKVLKPGGKLFILNHFTPDNWLRYVDWAFQPLSSLFHFKSSFHLTDVKELSVFLFISKPSWGKAPILNFSSFVSLEKIHSHTSRRLIPQLIYLCLLPH